MPETRTAIVTETYRTARLIIVLWWLTEHVLPRVTAIIKIFNGQDVAI